MYFEIGAQAASAIVPFLSSFRSIIPPMQEDDKEEGTNWG